MTLTDEMTRTAWLVRAAARDGVAPHQRLQAARDAAEEIPVTRPARLDPIVVPFDAPTAHRTASARQRIATIARDPRDVIDDTDSPAIARRGRTLTEAIRAYADSTALDGPHHGAAQAAAIEVARAGESHLAALIDDAMKDGATTGAAIAARLVACGVGVRL